MSIVRSTTVALSAAAAFGITLMTGASAYAEVRPAADASAVDVSLTSGAGVNAEVRPAIEQMVAEAAPSAKTSQRIAAGRTAPGEGWVSYASDHGLYIDVDTSSAHFTGSPVYTISVGGVGDQWGLTGTSTVYTPTATGFRVYVRWSTGAEITPKHAQEFKWYVNWVGVDNP